MAYLRRQSIPKKWPIPKKGTAYVVRPRFSNSEGIPLLLVLRDMLKLSETRKEIKKAINSGKVLVNRKKAEDEKLNILLFDTISLTPSNKNYRLTLNANGKFAVEEISEKESHFKISKVIDKKVLRGKKVQINLSDGRNFISEAKCSVNDSLIILPFEKKIEKCLALKEKAKVMIFQGKHIGKKGIVKSINTEEKTAEVEENSKTIKVLIKQIIAIE